MIPNFDVLPDSTWDLTPDFCDEEVYALWCQMFPMLYRQGECPGRTPVCGYRDPAPVWELVMHLNDYHEWTREEIADWVDTLEKKTA